MKKHFINKKRYLPTPENNEDDSITEEYIPTKHYMGSSYKISPLENSDKHKIRQYEEQIKYLREQLYVYDNANKNLLNTTQYYYL